MLRAVTELSHLTMVNPWERGLEVVRTNGKIQFILVRRLHGQRKLDRLVTEVDNLNVLREELSKVSRKKFGLIDLTEIDKRSRMVEDKGIWIKYTHSIPTTARVLFPTSKDGVTSLLVSWRGLVRVLNKRLAS